MRSMCLVFAIAACLHASSGTAATRNCADIALSPVVTAPSLHDVIPEDLIRLRDLGQPWDAGSTSAGAISVSPDGSRLAFQLRRADIDRNDYCLGIFVLSLDAGERPVAIDTGGELISAGVSNWDFADFAVGTPSLIIPKWSPDGRWVAFLKRVEGRTQVWRANLDGLSEPVTDAEIDVEDFAWLGSNERLIYVTKPALASFSKEVQAEALRGYHFDRRVSPQVGIKPLALKPIPLTYHTINLSNRTVTVSSEQEVGQLLNVTQPNQPKDAVVYAANRIGETAWLEPLKSSVYDPTGNASSVTLRFRSKTIECKSQACVGNISGLWWTKDGSELIYLRREGWTNSQIALYRWKPSNKYPHRIFLTDDILSSCQITGDNLICLQEGSKSPRRIVSVDLSSGKIDVVFEPNPEFQSVRLGKVERLHWRNNVGLETIGDLVLPPDHQPGQRHPLVIVQYITRGFLRGGTGDEYPIQWMAANGYAVLSFQRPKDYAGRVTSNASDFNRATEEEWIDRRSVLSALQVGIDLVLAKGVADPARIAITGLSDGTTTAAFALINDNKRFATAILSSCCLDHLAFLSTGEVTAEKFHEFGYPRFTEDGDAFWKAAALLPNVDRMPPLLLQLADTEYLPALATYEAFRERNRPIDLFVFPGETHVKLQPAHRSMIYRRNLAWLDFWLKGTERTDLIPADEIVRWRNMRKQESQRSSP